MTNYTYTDLGRQMMILDIGAPLSLMGVSWMTQYLEEFDLNIEDMKSVSCNQPFVFGPSSRYLSKKLIELPILVKKAGWKRRCVNIANISSGCRGSISLWKTDTRIMEF